MKKETVKTILKNIPVYIMLAMLLAFAVFFIVLPKKEFSENENRMLAKFPELSIKKISNGEFQSEFENFLSDQFPLRDNLLSVSVRASRLGGKKEINDVIYIRDEKDRLRLLDVYKKPENKEKFANTVNTFSGKLNNANVVVMLVPTAVNHYEEELPKLYKMQERPLEKDTLNYFEGQFSNVSYVMGISETLSLGKATCDSMYYIPVKEKTYDDFQTVSEDFYGTTWSKVCDTAVSPDPIEIYENPEWAGNITVTYEDTKEITDSPYNKEYLNKKDKYSMYLNNQHSLIHIENPNADLERTDDSEHSSLVIIKDSYANSLVPLLIDQYETIWVFDPRYYKGSISSWINEHKEVEDVLILYNLGTMDDDRGIGAIY